MLYPSMTEVWKRGHMATLKLLTNLSNFPVPIFKCSPGQWAFQNHSACAGGQLHFHKAPGLFTPGNALSMYTKKTWHKFL
jgi:hypothetical protein